MKFRLGINLAMGEKTKTIETYARIFLCLGSKTTTSLYKFHLDCPFTSSIHSGNGIINTKMEKTQ